MVAVSPVLASFFPPQTNRFVLSVPPRGLKYSECSIGGINNHYEDFWAHFFLLHLPTWVPVPSPKTEPWAPSHNTHFQFCNKSNFLSRLFFAIFFVHPIFLPSILFIDPVAPTPNFRLSIPMSRSRGPAAYTKLFQSPGATGFAA